MKPHSRSLIAIAGALLLLAISALVFIRTGSTPGMDLRAGPSPTSGETASSRDVEKPRPPALADREAVVASRPHAFASEVGLHGIVLDDSTGEPIESFEILHSPTGVGRARVSTILGYENSELALSDAFSGTMGHFVLPILDSGPESVCAFAEGYVRSDPLILGASGASDDVVIRLRKAAVVRGRVLDRSGVPVQNALVAWIDYRGETRTGPRERFERTDELGRFVLGSVPVSARSILAGREDLGEGLSQHLELEPGELAEEIVIELVRRGS